MIMKIEAVVDRVTVELEVPDECKSKITRDDIKEMVCQALGHCEFHQVVQLILCGVAQWGSEYSVDKENPVEAGVYIEVDWDSIETPMQDFPEGV